MLKIDVEGAEPLVLRGAAAILARSPALAAVVEFRNEPHVGGESARTEVLAFYESLGFELCLLRRNGDLDALPRPTRCSSRAAGVPSFNLVLRRR